MTEFAGFWSRVNSLSNIELEPQIRQFFAAFARLRDDKEAVALVARILAARPDLLVQHFAYLLWAAFQYVTDLSYSDHMVPISSSRIRKDIHRYENEIGGLCLLRQVNASFPARYVALQGTLSLLDRCSSYPRVVVDLGCSVGLGLRGINTHMALPPQQSRHMNISLPFSIVKVNQLIGVDLLDIANIDWKWISACNSPHPPKIEGFVTLEEAYAWLVNNGTPIRYVRSDIFDIGSLTRVIPPQSVDVIWTSNLFFEIGETPGLSFVHLAPTIEALLNKTGVWINADYTNWNKEFGSGTSDYAVIARRAGNLMDGYTLMTASDDVLVDLKQGDGLCRFLIDMGLPTP